MNLKILNKSLHDIKGSFSPESLLGSFLFFLVLSSWYVLRPVRNEMAVANVDDLPYLLAAGAIAVSYTHLTLPTNREV